MTEEKKYKVGDLAAEINISPTELLEFLKGKGVKIASVSSKVGEEAREMVIEKFSHEKKQSDANRRQKEEKERKRKDLETKQRPVVAMPDDKAKKKTTPVVAKAKLDAAESSVIAPAVAMQESVAATAEAALPEAVVGAGVGTEVEVEAQPETGVVQTEPVLEPEPIHANGTNGVSAERVSGESAAPVAEPQALQSETETVPREETQAATQFVTPTEAGQPPLIPSETALNTADLAQSETAKGELPQGEAGQVAAGASADGADVAQSEAAQTETAQTETAPVLVGGETEDDSEEKTELRSSIEREQAEINTKYTQSENIGGLKVFGEIDLRKKKKKKSFKEQAVDLAAQAAAQGNSALAAKLAQSSDPKQAGAKTADGKTADGKPADGKTADGKPAAKPADGKPVVIAKKTAREEQIERLERAKAQKKGGKKVDEREIERNIRQTMLDMGEGTEANTRQKFRKLRRREREEADRVEELRRAAEEGIIRITEYASTHEFADLVGVTVKEVIERCFKLGKFITINQRLDRETLEVLALEFGKEIQFISEVEATEILDDVDMPEDLAPRPPVVTIMGHVDHGKTSLLDYIRRSNVVAGESGGITQHIGAYEVQLENDRKITFLDTPGHEAFTAMRARGAQVTDIVILVVAADDSVMPQTKEAINHAKAANVPIVVALNKIDKPDANPDKIRKQLSEVSVLVEEWGGDTQCQEISAKKGEGVRELLDKVIAQADLMELKANHSEERLAKGIVIEAELDKGKGVVATVLVQQGLLKVGDSFVAGVSAGRVRAMLNERSNREELASPSQPVRVLGFEMLPQSGDTFSVMPSDREAREISQKRQVIKREQEFRQRHHVTLNELSRQIQQGTIKELRVIVKADVDGSVEALADGLMKTQTSEVKVRIIHRGVGQITESDVLLAVASQAIIIGFRVRPNLSAKRLAEREEIDIRFYTVIYHALEDVKDALEGLLAPDTREEVTATVEVRQVYRISKVVGSVAGCMVLDGKLTRDARVRLLRDGIQVYEGDLDSLKRFKDDVKEVESGFECGLSIKNFADVKVGDIVEAFQTVETKRKLVMS